MPRSFKPAGLNLASIAASARAADWREPRVLMRVIVGSLLLANLVAAAFAFHVFGRSPSETAQELVATQRAVTEQRNQLNRSRQIAGKVEKARSEGDQFLINYMTPRRTTYSTILAELQQATETAGMTWKEGTISPLDPVKGSDDLSIMPITASFEGTYPNLLKLVNLIDRSQRFLIIESLAAAPQPSGKTLSITIKLNTFVRGDTGGLL